MDYVTLTDDSEKLRIARDLLRGRETDHYRISLLQEPNKESRLAALEAEIEGIREEIAALESKVSSE